MTAPVTPYTPGPFSSKHFYVQWGGKLPGNESWSCGIRLLSGGGNPINDPTMNTAISNAVKAYHSASGTFISEAAKLSFVKVNIIGINGLYEADTTQETVIADLPGGGPATPPYPNQIAMAVSLTTGFSRGPAHRGRFYLPLPGFVIDTMGQISVSNAQGLKNTTETFLAALTTAGGTNVPAVMSRKSGAATSRPITGCEIGRVLDTQRRRRRSLIEAYV